MVLRYGKKEINTRQSLNLFIAGILLVTMYIYLMNTLSNILGFNTKITTYVYYGALWILLILSVPKIIHAITEKMVLAAAVFALLVVSQYFLFPSSRHYLTGTSLMNLVVFSPRSLIAVVPYILIGAAVTDMERLRRTLHTAARIGISMGTLSYMLAAVTGQQIHYDDMNNAYSLCVMVCLLIMDRQKRDIWFLLAGCLSLVLAGTRGPLMCVMAAVLLKVFLWETISLKKILMIASGVVLIIALWSGLLLILLEYAEQGLTTLGITELRLADYIRQGILLDSSGRDRIAEIVVQKILEAPIDGYGVGGDRFVSPSGGYVHNILLEMWASFGIVMGTVILLWMAYWLIRAVRSGNHALRVIVLALFSSVVLKLFLSSSYLYSKELFILLGICMAGCAARKRNGMKYTEVRNDGRN